MHLGTSGLGSNPTVGRRLARRTSVRQGALVTGALHCASATTIFSFPLSVAGALRDPLGVRGKGTRS